MVSGNPATTFVPITPNDNTRIGMVAGIYCGGAGDLICKDADGNQATFKVGAGQVVPISPAIVMAATTASAIVGLANTR